MKKYLNNKTIQKDLISITQWMNLPIDALILEEKKIPIDFFLSEINLMIESYTTFPKEKQRTDKIISLLKKGEPILPVFIEENSPFIMEGRHRIVAFHQMNIKEIPTIIVTVNPEFHISNKKNKNGL